MSLRLPHADRPRPNTKSKAPGTPSYGPGISLPKRQQRFLTFETMGDNKVCPECQALQGMVWSAEEEPDVDQTPPIHPNCRCTLAQDYAVQDKFTGDVETSQTHLLQVSLLDSFGWAKPLEPLLKLGEYKGRKFYRVVATHAGVKNRNGRVYTEDELRQAASSLSERQLDINHDETRILPYNATDSEPPENGVVVARYDPQDRALECIIAVSDPEVNRMIDSGQIKYVSIDGRYLDTSKNTQDTEYPTSLHLRRLALLTDGEVPGDPRAGIVRDSVSRALAKDEISFFKGQLDLAPRITERLIVSKDKSNERSNGDKEKMAQLAAEDNCMMEQEGMAKEAVWSTALVNDLPDSSFAYVEPGGKKDDQGKTTPRSLRHLPYKDSSGKVDLPHLRNALARVSQSTSMDPAQRDKAEKVLQAAAKAAGVGQSNKDRVIASKKVKERKNLRDKRVAEKRAELERLQEQVRKVREDLIVIDPEGDESDDLLNAVGADGGDTEDKVKEQQQQQGGDDQQENEKDEDDQEGVQDAAGAPRDPKMQKLPNDGHGGHASGKDDGGDVKAVLKGTPPPLREQAGNSYPGPLKGLPKASEELNTAKNEQPNPTDPAYAKDALPPETKGKLGNIPPDKLPPQIKKGMSDEQLAAHKKQYEEMHAKDTAQIDAAPESKVAGADTPQGQNPDTSKAPQVDNGSKSDKEDPLANTTSQKMGNPSEEIKTNTSVTKDSETGNRINESNAQLDSSRQNMSGQQEVKDAYTEAGEKMAKAFAQSFMKQVVESQNASAKLEQLGNRTVMTPFGPAQAPMSFAEGLRKVQEAHFQANKDRYEAIADNFRELKPIPRPSASKYKEIEMRLSKNPQMTVTEIGIQVVKETGVTASAASAALGQVWLPDMIILPTDLPANLRNYCQVQVIERGANIVHFTRITQPSFVSLTDLTAPSDASQTIDKIDITVAETGAMQEVAYSVLESATPDIPAAIERSFMYAAIIDEDSQILTAVDAAVPSGNVVLCSSSHTSEATLASGDDMAATYIAAGMTKISQQGYTVNAGDLILCLHPVAYDELLNDTRLTSFLNFGSFAPIQQGVIPQVHGVDIVRSTKVVTGTGSGSPAITTYHNDMWLKPSARGAYGLGVGGAVGLGISRDLLIETWRKIDSRELIIEASHRIAAAVIQANATARLVCV